MNIQTMIETAANVLEKAPTDLESIPKGELKKFAYASFVLVKSAPIVKNMDRYATADHDRIKAADDFKAAKDTMSKALAFTTFRSAKRRLSAVDRIESVASKLA